MANSLSLARKIQNMPALHERECQRRRDETRSAETRALRYARGVAASARSTARAEQGMRKYCGRRDDFSRYDDRGGAGRADPPAALRFPCVPDASQRNELRRSPTPAKLPNFIVPELGLTDTQFGLLTGFAFIVFYALMGLFMGAAADMLHRPRLVAAGLALWSLLTAISGAARGFVSLALPRMFIGVGESVLTPTSMSMLADRFPPAKLGFAVGAYYMGVPIGVGAS